MEPEKFAKPCVAAIIEKTVDGEKYLLMQTRQKEEGASTNGLLEVPAGKIREYENIFLALRREVWEETGLHITKIYGEESCIINEVKDGITLSFTPYCITQNLSGAYSIILNTFLCEAKGELLQSSNESQNIHWEKINNVREKIQKEPDKIFFMHIHALKKYLEI